MRLPLSLLPLVALAGCTVGPDYERPGVALTPAFATAGIVTPTTMDAAWWRAFNDPLLDGIVERALAQNLDIAAAAARVDQARAAAGAASAALLPRAGLNASAEKQSQSLDTPFGAASNKLGFPRDYELYQAGAEASWEIDLFGGLRRGREAARADLAGARDDADAVRLSIAAEAVDAYLQLRGLQARLVVAERQLDTERQLVALVRQRVEQGVSPDRELNRALGEEQGLDAALAPLRAGIAGQMNRLDILMGRQAGTAHAELAAAAIIPLAPDPAASVDPAALLRRRPDIASAERRLAAANARIGVAVADYYPHVSLSGLLGTASVGTAGLFTGNSVQAGGVAGLRWRLFDFGRVDAEVKQARGREAEALARYRGSVLRATEEVETALARLGEGRTEIGARERQVAALTKARDQARQAYQGGVVALVDVLDADRALLDASDRLAAARADTARASVAAVRALGGGWEERS
jgi:NodT family efflux transporter outer membrane factor (OMF) lipoprotein